MDEEYLESFHDWNGNGSVIDVPVSGGCVDELIQLGCPPVENMACDPWHLGSGDAVIYNNVYGVSGSGQPCIEYRTGSTRTACLSASYSPYVVGGFVSLGWVQVRINNDLPCP